jgi:uncharacterized membrane protein
MTAAGAPRWFALDIARGLAVVAMVIFHLIWDLAHFGYAPPNLPWTPEVRFFGHAIAFAFLFIAGVALVLANRPDLRPRAFARRLAIVGGAAGLVSLGTWLIFPGSWVFFGILHCIAAASVAALPLLFLPWPVALAAALVCLMAPLFVAAPAFNADALLWLGLGTREPLTQDWRPFLPWAGAVFAGVAAGGLLWRLRGGAPVSDAGARARLPGRWTAFLGRHSLAIYLLHQPALFALFSALALLSPAADAAADFTPACETHCIDGGGERAFCRDACACVAEEATRSYRLKNARDETEKTRRLNAIAKLCVGRAR